MLLGDEYNEYDENEYIELGGMFLTIFDKMVLYIIEKIQSTSIEKKKEDIVKLLKDGSTQTYINEENVLNWEIL